MRGYGQFCPVAKACEIFAERWTPLVLRELLLDSHGFNDLHRGVPLMSRTLLARRLEELERAEVIERRPKARGGAGWEYHLTPAGEEFGRIIESLGEWGRRWTRRQVEREDDLDAGLLMWDIHRRLHTERLPDRQVIVQFDFRRVPARDRGRRRWWLVLRRPKVDLCLQSPGPAVDLLVSADLGTLTSAWLGDIRLADAIRAGLVTFEGPQPLVAAFPSWLAPSGLARARPPRGGDAGRPGLAVTPTARRDEAAPPGP